MQTTVQKDHPLPGAGSKDRPTQNGHGDSHIQVEQGVVIFREGDAGACAYLIESGDVEISVWRNNRKVTLARRGPGEVFGEMAIIDEQPRSATVSTISPCRLLPITREQLANRINSADPVLRMFLKVILERFRSTLQNLRGIDHENLLGDLDNPFVPLTSDHTHEAAVREIKLEEELKQAIRNNQFVLFFQPITQLGTGMPVGVEALIRWQHPTRGLVAPNHFIPTAEASGLIVPISQWVCEEACSAHVRIVKALSATRAAIPDLTMSINLSAKDFTSAKFADIIRRTLTRTQVDPTKIRLEITENLLMYQPEVAAYSLKKCKDMGLSIAIDDFGTGYSNLSYLKNFPVDTIKIDRSFIHMIEQAHENYEIVSSIIDMAHKLNIDIVAEGVEFDSQVTILNDLGCDYGQGFLYSKPVPEPDLVDLIGNWDHHVSPEKLAAG